MFISLAVFATRKHVNALLNFTTRTSNQMHFIFYTISQMT